VLCGDKESFKYEHIVAEMLGGGMRQGGGMAAAGIIALEKMTERWARIMFGRATSLKGLSENRGFVLMECLKRNMCFFRSAPQIKWSTDE